MLIYQLQHSWLFGGVCGVLAYGALWCACRLCGYDLILRLARRRPAASFLEELRRDDPTL